MFNETQIRVLAGLNMLETGCPAYVHAVNQVMPTFTDVNNFEDETSSTQTSLYVLFTIYMGTITVTFGLSFRCHSPLSRSRFEMKQNVEQTS